MIKIQTVQSPLMKSEDFNAIPKIAFHEPYDPTARCKGADKYLVKLYKNGELRGDFLLDCFGYTKPVKGRFSLKGHVLHFNGQDLINVRHQSIIKLAIAFGWKEGPSKDECDLNALENESTEQ
jgi:hypothetical protein